MSGMPLAHREENQMSTEVLEETLGVSLLQVASGSVLEEEELVLPPRWELVDVGEVQAEGGNDVHYRIGICEEEIGQWKWDDWPENVLRPKKEVALGMNTLYKRKGEKIHPVGVPLADGSVPEGLPGWEEACLRKYHTQYRAKDEPSPFDNYLKPRIACFARGARLSPEREERLIVGKELWPAERELLREMLYKREGVLAWDWEHMGSVRPEVYAPQRIRTVPHEAWKHPGFQVPRSLDKEVSEMLRDRLKKGTMERCHGPYRNPWFLVKKK